MSQVFNGACSDHFLVWCRFVAQLTADQNAVLHPNADAPFAGYQDVVARLLPYHVFQQPQDDLNAVKQSWKGKEKMTSLEDELVEEITGKSLR